jgi:APA family basic amino acid/polyamine antiporter
MPSYDASPARTSVIRSADAGCRGGADPGKEERSQRDLARDAVQMKRRGTPTVGSGAARGRTTGEPESRLARRLGLADAVVIGLGSMLGTGVFVVFAPAAAAAGTGLLLALTVAAAVAYANATSSAQLAAQHPQAGGTYVYGRARLGRFWGYLAGVAFLAGKTASCGAAALAAGTYLWPEQRRPVAAAAVVLVTAVNYRGVTKTARAARVLVGALIGVLALVVAAAVMTPQADAGRLAIDTTPTGVLRAAALLFFAFAGYARIATLSEEVRDPARTIPRAVTLGLGVTFAIYAAVAAAMLVALGAERLGTVPAPLAAVVTGSPLETLAPVVRLGAVAGALGSFLSLMTGVSRTAFAMASEGDLSRWLAAVHPRHRVPHHAELVAGVVVLGVALAGGLRGAIGFSAFTVLVYYAVTNVSALTLRPEERRWPRALAVFGLVGCLTLAASLSVADLAAGLAVLGTASLWYAVRQGRGQP